MPEYTYSAMRPGGQIIHGKKVAKDRADLAAQLKEEGRFLISCSSPEDKPAAKASPAPSEPAAPAQEEAPAPPAPDLSDSEAELKEQLEAKKTGLPPMTTTQKLLLSGLIVLGFGIGFWRMYRRLHPPEALPALYAQLSLLHTGMTRQEVGSLFKGYSGSRNSRIARYAIPPDHVIEVVYDDTGGAGGPSNKISGSAVRVLSTAEINQSSGTEAPKIDSH